jgi:aliphatic nitrilase
VLKEYPKFTAAAVQIAPVYHDKPLYFDMPATLDNAVKAIKEAASNGATLVVFPELHIPGYCHFALELTKGPEYTGIWAEYLRHGIEVPSEETDALCTAARQNKVNVVMGINERVAKYGGRQHPALFISSGARSSGYTANQYHRAELLIPPVATAAEPGPRVRR